MSDKQVRTIEVAASEKTFDIAFREAIEQAEQAEQAEQEGREEDLRLQVVQFDSARCSIRPWEDYAPQRREYTFVFKAIYN